MAAYFAVFEALLHRSTALDTVRGPLPHHRSLLPDPALDRAFRRYRALLDSAIVLDPLAKAREVELFTTLLLSMGSRGRLGWALMARHRYSRDPADLERPGPRRGQDVPVADGADGPRERVRVDVLEQVSRRSRLDGGRYVVRLGHAREHQHLRLRRPRDDLAQRGRAVYPRHPQVEQHHIGSPRTGGAASTCSSTTPARSG